jgi:hypothetical protein
LADLLRGALREENRTLGSSSQVTHNPLRGGLNDKKNTLRGRVVDIDPLVKQVQLADDANF